MKYLIITLTFVTCFSFNTSYGETLHHISQSELSFSQISDQDSLKNEQLQKKNDSIKKVRYQRFRRNYYNSLNQLSTSVAILKSNILYDIRNDENNVLSWNKRNTNLTITDTTTLLTNLKTKQKKLRSISSFLKDKVNDKYSKGAGEWFNNFFLSIWTNPLYVLNVILIIFFLINRLIYKKFADNLNAIFPKIIFNQIRRYRNIQSVSFFEKAYFNLGYIFSFAVITFYSLQFLTTIYTIEFNSLTFFSYLLGYFLLSYIIKYISIGILKPFVRYSVFQHYHFYNFYFNKAINQIILPLLILFIFFSHKSYVNVLLNIFNAVFIILLVTKFFYLKRIIKNKQSSSSFFFSLFYYITELVSLSFWVILLTGLKQWIII